MSSDITTIGEYAKIQGGYAYKSKEFMDDGSFPVIKIKNVRFGNIDYSNTVYISKNIAEKTIEWKTQEGDILISMTGSGPNAPQSLVGRVARVWANEPQVWINQRIGRLVLKDKKSIHADFLYYVLSNPVSQEFLVSNSSGSANQANISSKTIESLPCPKVNYKQSCEIAKILRDIDNKIHLNIKINKILEKIAQAIFKSWFVDFDPVKARMAALASGGSVRDAELAAMRVISGKDEDALAQFKQEDPDAYKELAETAALFPSTMQESELGEIPEGWEVVHAEFFLELAYGKALKKDNRVHGEFPVYGSGGITGTHIAPIVDGPGIIVGRKGTIGSVYWEDKSFYPIDTTFYVIPKQEVGIEFIYFLLKKLGLDNMNTDAAVPGLNRNNVYRLEVPHYSDMLIKAFSRIAKKYLEVMNKNKIETENLTQIRDTLLPKLLAGEINLSLIETDSNEASL